MKVLKTLLMACAAGAAVSGAARAADEARIYVKTAADLQEYAALVPLENVRLKGDLALTPTRGGDAVPAQVITIGGKRYLAAVLQDLARNSASAYRLAKAKAPQPKSGGVSMAREGNQVVVRTGGQELTRYNWVDEPRPFLWPIYAPGQVDVTRSFPMRDVPGEDQDHPHHTGLWFTHGEVNGVDFWTRGEGKGIISEVSQSFSQGPAAGVLRSRAEWITPDGDKLLEDNRTYLFWNTTDPRVIDIYITLTATEDSVHFGDTKEGTFAIRVPKWMTVKEKTGRILDSEGREDGDVWGRKASWVSYWGNDGSATSGVAIVEHPDSPGHPTYWHARDYGLFAANPFGVKDFADKDSTEDRTLTLKEGESATFAYRVLVHSGDAEDAGVPAQAAQYLAPRAYTVVPW